MKRTVAKSLTLIVMMLPVISFAGTYSGGDGNEANPYQIGKPGDWQELMTTSADWDKHFIMTADVNLAGLTITPVGTDYPNVFNGVFDGDGHILRNAIIGDPCFRDIGIFGYVESAGQIRNVGVEDVNITGSACAGGLVGCNRGLLTSCYSTGAVSASEYAGGLVGFNEGGSITFCYSTGLVTGTGYCIGGLVGQNYGSITLSYSTGSVRSGDFNVGGLVGSNSGSVTFCYSTGSVTGIDNDDFVGGLVGYNEGGSITFCYSTGAVSGSDYVGGLVGENYYGSITSCFWDTQTSGQTTSAGGVGKTTAEMQTFETYLEAGWDFVGESENGLHDFWRITGKNYPHLVIPDWTLSGDGTTDNPYLVETATDLARVWLRPNACYRLNGNLDLSGISWSTAIIPSFAGIFDGQGFVIRNAVVNQPDIDYIGIFRNVGYNGQVRNICVEDVNITGKYSVGGLVGDNSGGLITSCYATGSVTGTKSVGGLVGHDSGGSMTSCNFTGSVTGTGDRVGGLMGQNYYGTITSCYSTGSVTGTNSVGALVGKNYGTISSCYSTGSVNGTGNSVGGVVGYHDSGSIASCYSTGSVTGTGSVGGLVGSNYWGVITSCYSTGSVSGTNYVGGLVGYLFSGRISSCYLMGSVSGTGNYVDVLVGRSYSGSIAYCFWDIQTSGQPTSVYGIGKTTAQMMTLSTFVSPPASWDFVNETTNGTNDYWMMLREHEDYPRLAWQAIFPGDIAGLYGVGMADMAEVVDNWLQEGCPANCEQADIDNSGYVDFEDFAILAENWLEGV